MCCSFRRFESEFQKGQKCLEMTLWMEDWKMEDVDDDDAIWQENDF